MVLLAANCWPPGVLEVSGPSDHGLLVSRLRGGKALHSVARTALSSIRVLPDASVLRRTRLVSASAVVHTSDATPSGAAHLAPLTQSLPAGATPAWGTELGLPTDFEQQFKMSSQLLGVGSFGSVHLATDRATGREVAVKKLRKDLPRGTHTTRGTGRISRQKMLKRLQQEINTLRALDGCVSAIAFEGAFESPKHVYLVMNVCHGGDLETLLKSCGALAERHAAMVVYEVLRLLRACHAAGILHGDVKPSNFLLAPGNPLCPVPLPPAGSPRAVHRGAGRRDLAVELAEMEAAGITSFTLAADLKSGGRRRAPSCPLPPADTTASSLTVPYAGGWLKGVDFGCSHDAPDGVLLNKMTGTPAFMAPEVFARSFGRPSDMWSLGMLAYQALSDRLPFWQDEDDMQVSSMAAVRSVVAEPIPLDYGPWLTTSPAGRDFVSCLLQHDTALRMTAEEAAQHPWFAQQGISDIHDGCLGGSSAAGAAAAAANNVVPGPSVGLHRSTSDPDLAVH